MILLVLGALVTLNGTQFVNGKGVVKRGENAYLTGGMRYGYAIYAFNIPPYVDKIKAQLKLKKISGNGIDILLKKIKGKIQTKKLNPKWKDNWVLWESTENLNWASSRPEYVPIYQFYQNGKIKIILFAEGGFFKRDRYIINTVSIEYNTLPDSIVKIVEEDPGLEFNSGMLIVRGIGFAKKGKNLSTMRAMALRAAKTMALAKISKIFGKKFIPHPIVLSDTITEEGKAEVLIGVPTNLISEER